MKRTRKPLSCLLAGAALYVLVVTIAAPAVHADEDATGQVQLPLEVYTRLIESAMDPQARPAPASYALGNARVEVTVAGAAAPRAAGRVQVQLEVEIFEDQWTLVPLLPAGTAVDAVTVAGRPVRLIASPLGLAWATDKAGAFTVMLQYRVDASRSESGFVMPLPVPAAAAIQLTATLPAPGLEASVIPAAGTRTRTAGSTTRVEATVPTTQGVQLAWHTPALRGHALGRAHYTGELVDDSVKWTGKLQLEVFEADSVVLPLFPRSVTLSELKVDGEPAPILIEDERFAALVQGRGAHTVEVGFQVPVQRDSGPPRIDVRVPATPVSRFELRLPGRAELDVTPLARATTRSEGSATLATVHVPMTELVTFRWSEAVPEEVRAEVRANATVYHAVHAEEGVLYVRGTMDYEVSRGETNRLELTVPADVQVESIDSPSGAVADWRLGEQEEDGRRRVSVYLDRQFRGALRLHVRYDRALGASAAAAPFEVPLIRPEQAQRQRGMVALLSSTEQTLVPLEETDAMRIGENQLPPDVRETIEMTVAHTFKYAQGLPRLVVETAVPERVQGKFDAQVDTLVSLGDVAVAGSASIQIHVKSGSIDALDLELPADVNLLGLTAPSLREQRVSDEGGRQLVALQFTQQMEGQFRIELSYERILRDGGGEVGVPRIAVRGAEVEQGRIGVEALSAAEVRTAVSDQLSPLDVGDLPRQLVLRTSNPILLAFKYTHAEPAPRLELSVTRHPLVGVQEAAIDRAAYRTLFTTDGLVVTTASFVVRNSSKQFLRVRLPAGAEVWSVFVDGRQEKPALAERAPSDDPAAGARGDAGRDVLVKIINSTEGFPVQLIYATPGRRMGWFGALRATLPRPDILVTHSSWDLFLPDGPVYARPTANLETLTRGDRVSGAALGVEFARLTDPGGAALPGQPLRIEVPAAGVHFAFEKLYANQPGRESWFRIGFASASARWLGRGLGWAGVSLLWLGGGLLAFRSRVATPAALAACLAGLFLATLAVRLYQFGLLAPLLLTLLLALVLAAGRARRRAATTAGVQQP